MRMKNFSAVLVLATLAACTSAPEQRLTVPRAPVETKLRIAFASVALREVSLPGYAAGEDELRDVLDDFGLVLGRQSGKPFGKALKHPSISFR